jgi:hypothetical protein
MIRQEPIHVNRFHDVQEGVDRQINLNTLITIIEAWRRGTHRHYAWNSLFDQKKNATIGPLSVSAGGK